MAVTSHFRLLLEVRWRCYRNALRASGVLRARFLAAAFTWLLVAVAGVGSSLAFLALGFDGAKTGKIPVIGMGLFFVFALWQLAPVIFEVTSPMLNFADLARYPISFTTYFSLHVTYGLFDPAALLALAWLAALWTGMLVRRPEWALRGLAPFLVFAMVNILSNRALLAAMERVLATRRGRERLIGAAVVIFVFAQVLIYAVAPRFSVAQVKGFLLSLAPLWHALPPGVATGAIQGGAGAIAFACTVLLIYAAVAAALLALLLRASFAGENYSESSRRSGAVQARPAWNLPGREAIAAVVEKEIRYAFRDWENVMNFITGPVSAVVIAVSSRPLLRMLHDVFRMETDTAMWPVLMSGVCVSFVSQSAWNNLGKDQSGFSRWPLSPVSGRAVLLGKNAALALLWVASLLFVNAVLGLALATSWSHLLNIALGATFAIFALLAAGNQFSVRMPLRTGFSARSAKKTTEAMVLVGVLLNATVGFAIWCVARVARHFAAPELIPFSFALLAAIAAALYLLSLDNAARYMESHAEEIAAELQ